MANQAGAAQRHALIIAGVNGAGKSTILPSIRARRWGENEIYAPTDIPDANVVDADAIARELGCGCGSKSGRLAIGRINHLIDRGEPLAVETTLAGCRPSALIERLRKEHYRVYLVYIGLQDVELSVARVVQRGLVGGHYIPMETLRRRYGRSLVNFVDLAPKVDLWVAVDNSNVKPSVIGWGGMLWQRVFIQPQSDCGCFLEVLKREVLKREEALKGEDALKRAEEAMAYFKDGGLQEPGEVITRQALAHLEDTVRKAIDSQPQKRVCVWRGGKLEFEPPASVAQCERCKSGSN
jgi:predicted ABC-type ATPase